MQDLQSGGCRFESRSGLLRNKVYSAFHPSGVSKWVPAAAGKTKAGMAHSDCGWTCGCAGKTVKSLENTCHTWALLRWWFTTKRHYIKCMHLYLPLSLLYVHVGLPVQPTKAAWWPWPFDFESDVQVTCDVGATSVPILVFLGLSVLDLGPMYEGRSKSFATWHDNVKMSMHDMYQ